MALWDVFHSDRLELVRGLSAEQIGSGLASGEIRDDDLVRPSGTTVAWARLAEVPDLLQPPAEAPTPAPIPPPIPSPESAEDLLSFPVIDWPEDDDYEEDAENEDYEERGSDPATPAPAQAPDEPVVPSWELTDDDLRFDRAPAPSSSHVALPVVVSRDRGDSVMAGGEDEEDEDEAVISLTRSGPPRVEELDLAAMVDVAFQLVLFFLVTATTILYKTLEIPKPSAEAPPSAVAQGRSQTIDELKEDYILVEIDPEGNIKLDREPVPAQMESLAEQLRVAREKTGRKTMLLSADFATPHRSAVLAYDAANEIGLGIAIAKPAPPQGPAPALKPPAPAAKPAPPK